MLARTILAGLAVFAGAGCASRPAWEMPLRAEEWELLPLDQVCRQLEEDAPDTGFRAANLAFVRKAEVLAAYVRLWQALEADGRAELRDEQSRWYATASREADDAGREYAGGTAESYVRSSVFAELAKRRAQQLRDRLAEIASSRSR